MDRGECEDRGRKERRKEAEGKGQMEKVERIRETGSKREKR